MTTLVRIVFKPAIDGKEVATIDAPVDQWILVPSEVAIAIFGGHVGLELADMIRKDIIVLLAKSSGEGQVSTFTGTYADALAEGWDPRITGLTSAAARGGVSAHASVLRADGTIED